MTKKPKQSCVHLMMSGSAVDIYSLVSERGKDEVAKFMKQLERSDITKLKVLFEKMCEFGRIDTKEKFRSLGEGLFEFKSYQIRILCFWDNRKLILTHGLKKKSQRLQKKEIEKANRLRKEYLERIRKT